VSGTRAGDHANAQHTVLKQDLFGRIVKLENPGATALIMRDLEPARPWLRWLARHLARRETRALLQLTGLEGVPRVVRAERNLTLRTWIAGRPMQIAQPRDLSYFRAAMQLLRQLHRRGVVHNDLAKEPNWLVTDSGTPALVDFQLAMRRRRRSRLFRALAHDDIRHLLKHKRSYLPERLTARERRILATPSIVSRVWMASGKRAYRFITRRVLRWSDREGAGDRQL
jgi:RIO-like serine/threonine protein kinase